MAERPAWGTFLGVLEAIPETPIDSSNTALLVIDMQYLDASREMGMGAAAARRGVSAAYGYYFDRVENTVVPNIQALQRACRSRGIPVLFVRISALSADLSDTGLLYQDLRFVAAPGSREAEILTEVAPAPGEAVLSKTCSSPFNGTAIDTVLRNMGVTHLLVSGVVLTGCVETTVRDAADRSYRVTLIADACAGFDRDQEEHALAILSASFCRVSTTATTLQKIEGLTEVPKKLPPESARRTS